MSILDTKKIIRNYIIVIIICLLFSGIYELFSHQVYSIYMIISPIIPVIGLGLYYNLKDKNIFDKLSFDLYNFLIATITIGMIVKGILDIYGTTNNLINIYNIVAIGLFIIFLITMVIERINKKDE